LASSLDNLILTDTIPENIERAKNVKNMKVLSIKELLEKVV
jgi:phosphoribosylpyrophosphate synthetase